MDGINPTLALAALLFGLSGNPQHTTHQSALNAQVPGQARCAEVVDAGNAAALRQGADPLVRRTVPATSAGSATAGCAPKR